MSNQLTQWILDYDSGNIMQSVDMGGLGAGYEQAIQSCAVEIIRGLCGVDAPEDIGAFRSILKTETEKAAHKLNNFGFSGAQVGAASNIASVFWRNTPSLGIEKMKANDPERIIKIKKGIDGFVELIDYKD